ncbi:HopJ type III effector protein [Thalassotalea marina]|uniref:Type III effector n=1 Tax=Thalassotalea marina TaxID=1673741 RepID=A0A919BIP0_9GAMM|nr:HopJ type III effector protein [Thalassotalea marina]GHF94092.1 type III effector [Thalassotalea marina]
MLSIEQLVSKIKSSPESIEFNEVMQVIADNYQYQPAEFNNGQLVNAAGTNEGSCKIFAFAKLNDLTEQQTLACFGQYYRNDVMQNPTGDDHQNIRNFMIYGWNGVSFNSSILEPK